MTTKIRKWGNSYAIRIPKYIIDKLGLRDGSPVEIDFKPIENPQKNGPTAMIIITPVSRR